MSRKTKENRNELIFKHRFIRAATTATKNKGKKLPTLLLLHGTGGNEDDLIPVGKILCPDCALLSPRGMVNENGMPRFFRRLAEGVFDMEDLKRRTHELAVFLKNASRSYEFDLNKTIAVGFSNGANIGASLILRQPEVLSGAILIRGMVPFEPDYYPDLLTKHILLSEGLNDPIVSKQEAERLFTMLKKFGAKVTLGWQDSGHDLTDADIRLAKEWLHSNFLNT